MVQKASPNMDPQSQTVDLKKDTSDGMDQQLTTAHGLPINDDQNSLRAALRSDEAMVNVLSLVHDADADLALMTTTSVVYAAIAVIDKQPWVGLPDAQDFVREAFCHCKAITMLGDAATLFDASENEGCAESTRSPRRQSKQEADEGLYPYHCSTPPPRALKGSGHWRETLSQQFVRPER